MSPDLINQLLWPFKQLPNEYLVIDIDAQQTANLVRHLQAL